MDIISVYNDYYKYIYNYALRLSCHPEDALDITQETFLTALKKIDTLNLKSNVMFHGQLKRKKVFDLMQKSMCFIMISDNETFGMVYLEAMLNGCITIASRNGGIDGIIKDNVNGFLCEQGNANELARILKNIDSLDLEKVLSIRKKGIETSIKFSDSNVAEKYLNDVLEWGNNGN